MAQWTLDQKATRRNLQNFFDERREDLQSFGSTVNQTFEAFVFASVVQWYRQRDWQVNFVNPVDRKTKSPRFRLKYSTRGAPKNYTFAVASKTRRSSRFAMVYVWQRKRTGKTKRIFMPMYV